MIRTTMRVWNCFLALIVVSIFAVGCSSRSDRLADQVTVTTSPTSTPAVVAPTLTDTTSTAPTPTTSSSTRSSTASTSRTTPAATASPSGGGTYYPAANPQLIAPARRVYEYLQSIQGKAMLAGQEERDTCTNCESERMRSITGKLPAVHGHDLADYIADPVPEAINDWRVRHQIPTFSWHMGIPGKPQTWENVIGDVDVAQVLQPGTSLNASYMGMLDKMATRLKPLQDNQIPVLFRPLHEMNGGWFWWSTNGPDVYKKMWIHLYDYFTKEKKLNNLIWVWSSAESEAPNAAWYPGTQYVDIVGTDTYKSNSNEDNWSSIYRAHKSLAPTKPVALTETDIVPDPDKLKASQNKMLWFLPWFGEYVDVNSPEKLRSVYQHSYIITADEMPASLFAR